MFLREHWYVAAWAEEIGEAPVARVILGEPIVLFRKADGAPVALEDRCPHRNLPLSAGRRRGDALECGYHGMVFAADGVCTFVPNQAVPAWARVRAYPVVERDRWVFIWMGDPARADPARVPGYNHRFADPDWRVVNGKATVKGGYRLILDNLLDLSHLAYVHNSSTGNAAVAERAEIIFSTEGDRVRQVRFMRDIPPAPVFVDYAGYDANIDRWQTTLYMPPSYIFINNGTLRAGNARPDEAALRSQGSWGFEVYHAITPETEATSHQFWAVAHPAPFVAPEKLARFNVQMRNVIEEDRVVYEAQQRAIDRDPDAIGRDVNPRGTIEADQGLLAMRRVIRRLYGEEQKAAAG